MSTRSGKRIHNSFHENTVKDELEMVTKSERKTRGKRLKENVNMSDLSVVKSKKRNNYVSYPTDDEMMVDAAAQDASEAFDAKPTRKLLKNTLKDHNIVEPVAAESITNGDIKKVIRLTRRKKKFAENVENGALEMSENLGEAVILNGKVKTKRGKKKTKTSQNQELSNLLQESVSITNKSKKKKKKGKRTSDFLEEKIVRKDTTLNKSNTSIDSYHSAAGSPLKQNHFDNVSNQNDGNKSVTILLNGQTESMNETLQKETESKLSLKHSTFDKIDYDSTMVPNDINTTFDKSETEVTDRLNTTFEKQTILEKIEPQNGMLNSTFEKKTRQSSSLNPQSLTLNATFEKANIDSKTVSLNSTYDKETNKKLDTTFEKSDPQNKSISAKSSLISSDRTINVTFDKSDNSRISITSDESRTENIVNTTPLLIESSLEDSRISDNLPTTDNSNTSQKDSQKKSLTVPDAPEPVTPLKREGTFTKDGPDVIIISKPKVSLERTPMKKMSLPSPGFTPFHVTRSSQREKSQLNITRSMEKSTRRSSLADLAPRQTKVMFCSPMNNPGVMTQHKKKIIKSSLKGSNKSFIFDESDARPGNRKRSYTSGAEPTPAKRTRLAEGLQESVKRLSRPRSSSATAKLTDNTREKDTPAVAKSPGKPSRTKLPNFAALHEREFARMESLDECQERKAKRAKKLLTPRGRSTRGTSEKAKPATNTDIKYTKNLEISTNAKTVTKPTLETPANAKTVTKPTLETPANAKTVTKPTLETPANAKTVTKPTLETPANAKTFTKSTLEALRPGFTRFGFKMHIDGNPFSVPNKTETKAKENRTNTLTRQATLPLLPATKGFTIRKETAKQVIMREKSFTSLSNKREVKRKEDRTIIKGVRTNRRFELQMQMRNLN